MADYSDKKFLSSIEVADYLGMDPNTVRGWRLKRITKGKFSYPPFIRIGRTIRYLKSDIDQYVIDNKSPSKQTISTPIEQL